MTELSVLAPFDELNTEDMALIEGGRNHEAYTAGNYVAKAVMATGVVVGTVATIIGLF